MIVLASCASWQAALVSVIVSFYLLLGGPGWVGVGYIYLYMLDTFSSGCRRSSLFKSALFPSAILSGLL
jgi:hypothetical protein